MKRRCSFLLPQKMQQKPSTETCYQNWKSWSTLVNIRTLLTCLGRVQKVGKHCIDLTCYSNRDIIWKNVPYISVLVTFWKYYRLVNDVNNWYLNNNSFSVGMERDLWVIIEYCPHGNLLDFLRKRRDIFEAIWTTPTEHADVSFTTIDQYICALQIARAMDFLASRRVSRCFLNSIISS